MSYQNKKYLIFNSDDFGHSNPFNMGVYKGIKSGIIKTSCVLSNTEGYGEAVSLSKDLKETFFGIHINLVEGKSLTKNKFLVDSKNNFNNGYINLLKKSFDKNFINAAEFEMRAQIERTLSDFKINHINSHVHTHSIPNLFKLIIKLAEEYKIPYIRTQFEKPYFVKSIKKHLTCKYPVNLIKLALLDFLSIGNKKLIKDNFITNDYLIGVTYTGFMDKNTILEGLKVIDKGIVEVLIHPAYYEKEILKPNNYGEFLIIEDKTLIEDIKNLGFILTDCSLGEK